MKTLIRFPNDHQLNGYGYDIVTRKVYSFKRNNSGTILKPHPVGDGYTIGRTYFKNHELYRMANQVNAAKVTNPTQFVNTPAQFIVFNKVRNYSKMFSHTSVEAAVNVASKEIGADSMSFKVLDVSTNKVYDVATEEVVVRRVVGLK